MHRDTDVGLSLVPDTICLYGFLEQVIVATQSWCLEKRVVSGLGSTTDRCQQISVMSSLANSP